MSVTRRLFLKCTGSAIVCLSTGSLLSACGSGTGSTSNGNFPVILFSDVHFNPFYDPTLFPELVTADAAGWDAIFRSSSITTPSTWGRDTNYPLLALTLASIRQNLGASPLLIFTGDILGHGIPQQFYSHYYASQGLTPPATPDPVAVAAMKSFTDKTVSFFMSLVRSAIGSIPVLFALGNIDSYSGYGPNILDSSLAPDNSFLINTAELYYSTFLNGSVDHQEFLTTFTSAGYYAAEPAGTDLVVIGLNTILFSPEVQNATSGTTARAELDWFELQLATAKAKGKKVWLLMHSPPGADIGTTTGKLAESAIPDITASATMLWMPDYQATFLDTVSRYPGLITQIFAGHTHMDEFRILPSTEVVEIAPGISPWLGNNPAFKLFTFSGATHKATDYSSLSCDLAASPAQFATYYTFSAAYSMQGFINSSLTELRQLLVTDYSRQARYKGSYFSGHNYTVQVAPMNEPITYGNWPVFWSGIGNMDQTAFITGVSTY